MFEPFLKSFFVRSSDPTHIKLLKLEILTNLATQSNISMILREFQVRRIFHMGFLHFYFYSVDRWLTYSTLFTELCTNAGQGICFCIHRCNWKMRFQYQWSDWCLLIWISGSYGKQKWLVAVVNFKTVRHEMIVYFKRWSYTSLAEFNFRNGGSAVSCCDQETSAVATSSS